MNKHLHFIKLYGTTFLLACSLSASASEPWFGWGQLQAEEQYFDGRFDEEDWRVGTAPLHPSSAKSSTWLSLVGFTKSYSTAVREVGAMATVGIPLDQLAQTRHSSSGSTSKRGSSIPIRASKKPVHSKHPLPKKNLLDPSKPPAPLPPTWVRAAVAAAWRAHGLQGEESRLKDMTKRARWSAALPETRLRATHTQNGQARVDLLIDEQKYYDRNGFNMGLEARLTWRFDRLHYSEAEPKLARMRMDQIDAKSDIAKKVLHAIFQWQQARLEEYTSPPRSKKRLKASEQRWEAEMTLDVLTGGWWSTRIQEDKTLSQSQTPKP